MIDLKSQYHALKSLAKQMMKVGNIAEYFKLLNELSLVESKILATR